MFDGKARSDLRSRTAGQSACARAWPCEAISGYDEGKRPEGEQTDRPIEIWLAEIDGAMAPVRLRARIGGIGIGATCIAVEWGWT